MWLTMVLLAKQPLPRRLFSGKHRIPWRITMQMQRDLLRDLAFEEENLFYLRQPYLTLEQERGTSTVLGKGKAKIAKRNFDKQKVPKHVTADDHLGHLRTTEAWE